MAEPRGLLGQIAVREGLLSPAQVDEGLRAQKDLPSPRKIGALFVERGFITQPQLEALLEIQRQRLEALADDPARGGPFGALVLRLGYVTPAQLEESLRDPPPAGADAALHLGQGLMRRNFLSAEQLVEILRRLRETLVSCPGCKATHDAGALREGSKFLCARCGGVVQAPFRRTRVGLSDAGSPASASASPPPSSDRFRMDVRLGEGGMGEVWKAWDKRLQRWVALKFLKSDMGDQTARFAREAQTAAKLTHPNIAAVYEVGRHEGRPFIAMQFIEGRTLGQFRGEPPALLAGLIRQAALGVQYAHERGIIHRDLKPGNIMVAPGGKSSSRSRPAPQVFVMDFGLAKSTEVDSSLSVSGAIIGTPPYMSPEQAGAARNLDARADVYSLGATLYELLTGRVPFPDTSIFELLKNIAGKEPTPVRKLAPAVAADLETVVMKCLEKDPARRYPTALELAEELGRWLDGEAILAHPPSRLYRAAKFLERHRRVLIPTAAAALLAAAAVTWGVAGALGKASTEAKLKATAADREAQEAALKLLEAGRPALDEALRYLYRKEADYGELVRRVDAGQKLIERAIEKTPRWALARYHLGRAWEIKGDEDQAEEQWRKAIELDPAFAPAHDALGRLLLARSFIAQLFVKFDTDKVAVLAEIGRLAKAASAEFEAAQGITGSDDPLQAEVAAVLRSVARGETEEGLLLARSALEKFGKREGAENLHWLIARASAGEARLPAYDQALSLRPQFPAVLVARSSERMNAGDLDGGIRDCSDALKIRPRFPEAFYNRAFMKAAKGDIGGAIEDYGRALDCDPGRRNLCAPHALNNRAGLYRKQGDLAGAAADYAEILRLNPRSDSALASRAGIRFDQGDLERARTDVREALRINPQSGAALFTRSLIREESGDLDGAIADLRAAIRINQDHVTSHSFLAEMLGNKGDIAGAMREAGEALKLDPAHAETWFRRGNVHISAGNLEGAVADLTEAVRINPRFVEAYVSLARARRARGDAAGAIAACDEAIRLNPGKAEAYSNRGTARADRGDLDGALADFEAALKIHPRNPAALLNRATARGAKGDANGAIADYEKALEAAPPDWPHRSKVQELLRELKR